MFRSLCNSLLCGLALLLTVVSVSAQEWTRFRGPNGSGVAPATTIPTVWTEADYNWKVELPGIGHASPVIWGDKIFLISANDESAERIVSCLSSKDGHTLWERRYPSTVHTKHKFNSFASSTPAIDAEHVYVSWTAPEEFTLMALDHNGRDVWKLNLGPFNSQHSGGTSPIVYEDMVVIGNEQDGDSFLTAVACKDGHTIWRTPRETAVVAYSTPCVYHPPQGPEQLIFNSQSHGISGIDPHNGKTLWEFKEAFDKRSVSSPVIAGGLIFGSCGSGGGGNYVVAVKPGTTPELAYKVTEQAPYVPTIVAKGDLAFLWSDKGIVKCIKAATGDVVWRERVGKNYSGSPICVGDYLYCVSEDGTVVVLSATENYQLFSENSLGEDCRSTPAVAGGRLYLRTYTHLISLGAGQ